MNDCKQENIDWRTYVYKRYSGTTASTANVPQAPKSGCALFTDFGGAVTPIDFNKYKDANYETQISANAPTNVVAGHAVIRWANRKNELTPANDIAIMFVGVNQDLCRYILDPNNPPAALPNDTMSLITDANNANPGTYTTSGELINLPENIAGDFFATTVTNAGVTYCHLGAIILPQ